MHAYRDLLADRGVRWPLVAVTVERLSPGMLILGLVLLVRDAGLPYTVAGLVTAAHQAGLGLAAPVQGRLVDRLGQPRVLLPDAVLYLLGTVALVVLIRGTASVALVVGVAVLTGAVHPPASSAARVALSHHCTSARQRQTAFAVVAILVEVGFIIGPVATVLIAARFGAGWPVALAGLLAALGAAGLAATGAARAVPRRAPTRVGTGALKVPAIRVVVGSLAAMAVGFGVIDIVVPAVAEAAGDRDAAGWLIAAIASGSLVGGLVYGARVWPGTLVGRLQTLALGLTIGLALLSLATAPLGLFAVALFVVGLGLAPLTVCVFQLIDEQAPAGSGTEAQQWTQAAVVAGLAVGAALAGFSVEHAGPGVALLVGAGGLGLGTLALRLGTRWLDVPPTIAQPTTAA